MKFGNKGFTLVELLVVISIVSLLNSVVLTGIKNARASARDSRRISDIRQIRNALELYKSSQGYYPPSLSLLTPKYIKTIPQDPLGSTDGTWETCRPSYCYTTNADYYNNSARTSYHLGVLMEKPSASLLKSDSNYFFSSSDYFISSNEYISSGYDFDGNITNLYDIGNY